MKHSTKKTKPSTKDTLLRLSSFFSDSQVALKLLEKEFEQEVETQIVSDRLQTLLCQQTQLYHTRLHNSVDASSKILKASLAKTLSETSGNCLSSPLPGLDGSERTPAWYQ